MTETLPRELFETLKKTVSDFRLSRPDPGSRLQAAVAIHDACIELRRISSQETKRYIKAVISARTANSSPRKSNLGETLAKAADDLYDGVLCDDDRG